MSTLSGIKPKKSGNIIATSFKIAQTKWHHNAIFLGHAQKE